MDQPIALPLTGHTYHSITPDQINHKLTDDGWSTFDFGPLRVTIRASDLTQVRAARQIAQSIAAQAGFWESDLAVLEERLVSAEHAHTADAPGPVEVPTPAPEPPTGTPEADEPYGGDDPELDAAVERVATMPETRRAPRRTPAKEK